MKKAALAIKAGAAVFWGFFSLNINKYGLYEIKNNFFAILSKKFLHFLESAYILILAVA